MKPDHKYVTNACFFIGAAAVYLYDRYPPLHWLFGSILAAAAITATVAYFSGHWEPPKGDSRTR
jgi:hypothetical protein